MRNQFTRSYNMNMDSMGTRDDKNKNSYQASGDDIYARQPVSKEKFLAAFLKKKIKRLELLND